MNRGEIAWQVAHGETPDNVRNHAALKGLSIPRTGRPGVLGILVTKTLVIAGEAGTFTTPSGARGAMLRAYDKATGREVGDGIFLPTGASGVPMTYLHGGKQYVVIAVSGAGYSGEYLAFRLPQ
jgi:glucose dehydrogenase